MTTMTSHRPFFARPTALLLTLALLLACDEPPETKHWDEDEHLSTCAAACQKAGSKMQRYVDLTGECVCGAPAAATTSSTTPPPPTNAGQ